uniref:N-acetyltransferase domain-containing protein n=1 Tax=Macrostomum lignano TaxID=282301 RepID=A0A1I8FFE7_9PLAT
MGGGGGSAPLRSTGAEPSYPSWKPIGFRVGQAYVEKMTKDDCRDFETIWRLWTTSKTNHTVVSIVVIDEKFSLLVPMARAFPCGLIRCALTNLGLRPLSPPKLKNCLE